jgi:formate dehydrogenase major subunit
MAAIPSAASPRRAARTRRPISSRSWSAGFGNNNVDTCARVCHSPTGYGLGQTYGTSAGTQDFDSVEQADVIIVIGANPTDGHPGLRLADEEAHAPGCQADRHRPAPHRHRPSPHVKAEYHLPLKPGTNVARGHGARPCDRHRRASSTRPSSASAATGRSSRIGPASSPRTAQPGGESKQYTGVPAELRGAARLYATGGNGAIYYGLGVTEHSQGSTTVMAIANIAMATGNIGREGVGVNPLRGQNNVQGSCDMGSFPHELPGTVTSPTTPRATSSRSSGA